LKAQRQAINTYRDAELSVGPGFSGRAGFGPEFVKMFQADFGPAYKSFCNIKSTDFFLSWRRFVLLTAVTSVSEMIFLQQILFANTAAFFYSLLRFDSHSFWEDDSGRN